MIINEYIKVGIVGAAGYTAGELLRILANHRLDVPHHRLKAMPGNRYGRRIRIYWERRI